MTVMDPNIAQNTKEGIFNVILPTSSTIFTVAEYNPIVLGEGHLIKYIYLEKNEYKGLESGCGYRYGYRI